MAARTLAQPGYDPAARTPGIVHLGVGNFHRAHQAQYVDDLLALGDANDWGIVGVNLLPSSSGLLDAVRRRGMRYVLKTLSPDSEITYREIASILDCVDATKDPEQAIGLLGQKEIRLVTMTITGGGYHLTAENDLDLSAKAVAGDLAGEKPSTVYGYLAAGLKERMASSSGAVTLLSCDNMRANGHLFRRGMEQFVEAAGDKELAAWMKDNVSFPCSMVDRITPVTPAGLSKEVGDLFGIEDDPSLMAESFIQWVIEDDFVAGRPPLEEVGVQVTDDVFGYEEVKIRVLNGGHMALAFVAALRGHEYVWQAMKDKEVLDFFDNYETEEVIPAIEDVKVVDLGDYHGIIRSRFSNPNLDDTIARLCRRATSKVPEFVVPTVADTLERGAVPKFGLSILAAWYEVMRRCANGNGPIKYEDPGWDAIKGHLAPGGEAGFANDLGLWGDLPKRHPGFVDGLVARIKDFEGANGAIPG